MVWYNQLFACKILVMVHRDNSSPSFALSKQSRSICLSRSRKGQKSNIHQKLIESGIHGPRFRNFLCP